MVGHGGSSAGSYLADYTSPIPSHCASIVATSTVRVKRAQSFCLHLWWELCFTDLTNSGGRRRGKITTHSFVHILPFSSLKLFPRSWVLFFRLLTQLFVCASLVCRNVSLSFWLFIHISIATFFHDPGLLVCRLLNTYTAKPVYWCEWISDSYCSLKPLCSGMGEVVPARTSPTLLPPSPHCAVIILFQSVAVHQLPWLAL